MKKNILLCLMSFFIISGVYAIPVNNKLLNNEQKTSNKYQRKAKRFYKKDQFFIALDYYQKAYELTPKDVKLNLSMAFCYYNLKCYQKSKQHFIFVNNSKETTNNELNFYLARSYHLTMSFDTAIFYYNQYLSVSKNMTELEKTDIQKLIKECESGKILYEDQVNVDIF